MKIKVLLVMPNKEVQLVKIPASTKYIKSFIGNELYKVRLSDNTVLLANKNANVDEFNRIFGENVLLGTFLIASIKNNHWASMKKKDIRRYCNMFKLRKHQRKVDILKEEYLEKYYSNLVIMKQRNAEKNHREIMKLAA